MQLTMPSASTPSSTSSAISATPVTSVSQVSSPSEMPSATNTSSHPSRTSSGPPCCETGRPVLADPITGTTICSCQYDAHILNYQRLAASAGIPLMYGPAAAAAAAAMAAYGSSATMPNSATPNNSGSTVANQPPPPPPPGSTIPGPGENFLPLSPEQLQSGAPFFPPPVSDFYE